MMSLKNSPLETLHVNSKKVACDGGQSSSEHPLVYLNMGKKDFVICPYCSKFFTIKQSLIYTSHDLKKKNDSNKK
jgi:uncharacterized Zn-finger protein